VTSTPLLRAVVPVLEVVTEGLGVASIEQYDAGVVVRWLYEGSAPRDDLMYEITLADDLGTPYACAGGGYYGPGDAFFSSLLRGESLFRPGVPSHAKRLRVGYLRRYLDVPL
jgi:hypothetical protein